MKIIATRTLARLLLVASSVTAWGCSSDAGPDVTVSGDVTLRVTNATCAPGPCAPVQVRAFPGNQPRTPGGLWSLEVGTVDGPAACLMLPANGSFRVTDAGTGETTTWTWTQDDPVALGALEPGTSVLMAAPSTGAFVPTRASGWTVTLPGGTDLAPAGACR
jgi:hypothetical protein